MGKIKRLIPVGFILLCSLSCEPKKTLQELPKKEKINVAGEEFTISKVDSSANILIESVSYSGVIFSKDYKVDYNFSRWQLRDTTSENEVVRFIPTLEDIVIAEAILKRCFEIDKVDADSMSMHEDMILGLPNYHRQYFGAINKRGEKLIWINCFRKPMNPNKPFDAFFKDWKIKEVWVQDGGKAFFNVMINIQKEQCFNFFRNSIGG